MGRSILLWQELISLVLVLPLSEMGLPASGHHLGKGAETPQSLQISLASYGIVAD